MQIKEASELSRKMKDQIRSLHKEYRVDSRCTEVLFNWIDYVWSNVLAMGWPAEKILLLLEIGILATHTGGGINPLCTKKLLGLLRHDFQHLLPGRLEQASTCGSIWEV